ncbi:MULTISPECIES: hypothetical protein [unclassified Bifidobacterium]|uniref:hypothetical protein n=1 Tax=unclassified Bifidobacterium TaxID=2608897 RepID=UPI00112C001C|nr:MULTISPECIES: hypothetical protein [unclassified Bifidobacterium]TPF80744.1 hypothetical protein BW08_03450 [Bifidobacterium sp. UTCIF-24]TPF84790.1 hypothetical protein BW07_03380 [Bifidobacterium sp. UTCIF-36]TPF90077.1 hypothetical protein BW10_03725 [Bifidobacterium sp. UTBIF-56]
MKMKYLEDTYRDPGSEYPISAEIRRRRGPGALTFGVLVRVAHSLLQTHPRWQNLWDEPEDAAFEFCYLCDGDGAPVALNPKFVTLYCAAASDNNFRALARRMMYQWMVDEDNARDFGRLVDRIEKRLARSSDGYVREKAVECANVLHLDVNGRWYRLPFCPRALVRCRIARIERLARRTPVDWPSEDALREKHLERQQRGYIKNDKGNIVRQAVRDPEIGKRDGQFDKWLYVIFNEANGALAIHEVTQLVVDVCPGLVQDGSDREEVFLLSPTSEVFSRDYDEFDDPTFNQVLQMQDLEDGSLDQLSEQSLLDEFGFVNPEDIYE